MALQERSAASTFSVFPGGDSPRFQIAVGTTGWIESISPPPAPADQDIPEDRIVTPGLVDLQVNGFAGIDFNSTEFAPDAFENMLWELLASGVTRFLPTLITADEDALIAYLDALDEVVSRSELGRMMVTGYHIEGPFLSNRDGYSGCHPAEAMRDASLNLVDRLLKNRFKRIRILTVAPEAPGVIDLIPELRARGITCSLGHTAADFDTVGAAVAAGATMSTHLGNGLPHELSKRDNPLLTQLAEDRLFAGFIADGIHIRREYLRSWIRAKTVGRTFLVTDASSGAGPNTPPGLYTMGASQIERSPDGAVRIPGSPYLAGSSVWMDQMVRNVMTWCGFGWADVLRLCRINPLHAIGEAGALPVVGDWADFVEWSEGENGPVVENVHIGPWTWKREE